MDFFVSASDKPYYHWQLSLLVESFKELGLEANLAVCLTGADQDLLTVDKSFVKNLIEHKRFYKLLDFTINKEYKYDALNKIYSLLFLLKQRLIKQPFLMFLEPDVIIKDKLMLTEDKVTDFLYSLDANFNFDNAEKMCPNFWQIINLSKEEVKENWMELGNILAFSNFPEDFFQGLILTTEMLIRGQKDSVWEDTLKLSLILMLIKAKSKIRITKVIDLESPALSLYESKFLTYRNGIPPNFFKSMFKYETILSVGNPIEILSKIYNCPNTKYISDLSNKILDSK